VCSGINEESTSFALHNAGATSDSNKRAYRLRRLPPPPRLKSLPPNLAMRPVNFDTAIPAMTTPAIIIATKINELKKGAAYSVVEEIKVEAEGTVISWVILQF